MSDFLKDYCDCCHLKIYSCDGPYYNLCSRKSCVDMRKAAERQREIDQRGKYILQWETFDAQTEIRRFDDLGECRYHADLIRESVADLFIVTRDGHSVELCL